MWDIDGQIGHEWPRGLWGRTAADIIESHLAFIERLIQEIRVILKHYVAEKSARSLEFVMNSAPDVLKKLESIGIQMASVKALSDDAFKVKHQAEMNLAQSRERLRGARDNVFLGTIYESRDSSGRFYDSFCIAKATLPSPQAKLEIDVYSKYISPLDPATRLKLQYNLYLPVEFSSYDVVVEGPLPLDSEPRASLSSFIEACRETRLSTTRQLFKVGNSWFGSKESREAAIGGQKPRRDPISWLRRMKPVSSILYSLTTAKQELADQDFPLSERISFAFKTAEYGFLFCGTNWMANVRLKNVQTVRDEEQIRRFYLETNGMRQKKPLDTLDERRRNARHFAEDTLLIGILMLQTGTGQVATYLRSQKGEHIFRMSPSTTVDHAGAENKTLSEVCTLLQRAIGDEYAKAVETCIQCGKKWLHDSKNESLSAKDLCNKMLQEYYNDVYLP
ncbi:hypothetical protein G7054_g5360 [Neopestalotiopsis clavispora]|nr:hypothetical protein G7054_g5360 [Neopestalotiopsis clavispora]